MSSEQNAVERLAIQEEFGRPTFVGGNAWRRYAGDLELAIQAQRKENERLREACRLFVRAAEGPFDEQEAGDAGDIYVEAKRLAGLYDD